MSRRRRAGQLVVAVGLVTAFVFRSSVDAQLDAVVTLATALDVPVLAWTVAQTTPEPRTHEESVGGTPTVVVRPARGDSWPALVFVNGATPLGRHHPDVQRLARGLARSGYLVLVPELPGLRGGELTAETLGVTLAVAREAVERPDALGGRTGFIGVSVGMSLALVAAAEPDLRGRTTVVSGLAPYADLRRIVHLATTGLYPEDGRVLPYETRDFVQVVVARSLAASLPPGDDRDTLLAELRAIEDREEDPLAPLRRRRTDDLGPDAAALVALLANRDPARFDELYAALPAGVRATVDRLSPVDVADRIEARIEIATAPQDDYFPPAESRALVERAPDARLTITAMLAHADPDLSPRLVGDLLRFDAYAVRTLRAARD